ncbi:MAG: hypothetical protein AAGL98_04155 [Planctomycetota bacterium]
MLIRVEAAELGVIMPLRAEVLRDGQPAEDARFDGDHDAETLRLAAFGGNPGDGGFR